MKKKIVDRCFGRYSASFRCVYCYLSMNFMIAEKHEILQIYYAKNRNSRRASKFYINGTQIDFSRIEQDLTN